MGKKRPSNTPEGSSRKIQKTLSFAHNPKGQDPPTSFRWLPSLGENKTCWHGVNLHPTLTPNVALFDLDDTLIQFNPNHTASHVWWRKSGPAKLRELAAQGFTVVIITNQAYISEASLAAWRTLKMVKIATELLDVPFRVFAATKKDGYRKPMLGMWRALEDLYQNEGVKIDKARSFFIGDAAGRPKDHAASDRKWALNAGISFHTPEEYFDGTSHQPFTLDGFHPASLPNLPLFLPTSSPLIPHHLSQELIILVGFPCCGKTFFYKRHFEPHGYVHINSESFKTRNKRAEAAEEALSKGRSCVIDQTNETTGKRQRFILLAQKKGVRVRCILFEASKDKMSNKYVHHEYANSLAWHNNLYRAYNLPPSLGSEKRAPLPEEDFKSYKNNFEPPTIDEGIADIKIVNWVWEGTSEAKQRWSMWYS